MLPVVAAASGSRACTNKLSSYSSAYVCPNMQPYVHQLQRLAFLCKGAEVGSLDGITLLESDGPVQQQSEGGTPSV